jgi:hypothetical protein
MKITRFTFNPEDILEIRHDGLLVYLFVKESKIPVGEVANLIIKETKSVDTFHKSHTCDTARLRIQQTTGTAVLQRG